MARKPKFYEVETDKNNRKLRKRVKALNKLIKKVKKTPKQRERLQKLLDEDYTEWSVQTTEKTQ